jgi:hypothetical protein
VSAFWLNETLEALSTGLPQYVSNDLELHVDVTYWSMPGVLLFLFQCKKQHALHAGFAFSFFEAINGSGRLTLLFA